MRKIAAFCLLLCSTFAFGQSEQVLTKGRSEWAVFVGGAQGFGKRSGTHIMYSGVRYGRVFTGEHLGSWLRGNAEARVEMLPIVQIWQAGKNATGGEFRPLTLVWNFKGNHTVKPFFELGGGLLVTNHDVPQNTNNVNFTPQGGPGFHFYLPDHQRAFTLQTKYMHISNAGLDRKNSGVNATLQITLGYTWFR